MSNEFKKLRDWNVLDFICKYEGGELTDDQVVEGFQKLHDAGLINQLQGSYQRTLNHLVAQGLVTVTL